MKKAKKEWKPHVTPDTYTVDEVIDMSDTEGKVAFEDAITEECPRRPMVEDTLDDFDELDRRGRKKP